MNAVLQNKTALDFMRIIRTIMAKTRPQLKKEPHETSKVLLLACLYNQIGPTCKLCLQLDVTGSNLI